MLEASRLRHAIALNQSDYDHAKEGKTIHYILDANVIGLFTQPASNAYLLGPFSRWLDDDTLITTATVTAEFLMSRALPGRIDGEPSLLTPDHFEEVARMGDRAKAAIAHLSDAQYDEASRERERNNESMMELVAHLRDDALTAQAKLDLLARTLRKMVKGLVDGPVSEIVQLNRVLSSSIIARLDSRPWFHLALEPNFAAEAEWVRRVQRARLLVEARPGVHKASRSERSHNIIADARSFALIVAMIEASHGQNDDRFLFVTADDSLLKAAESYIL
jgi:hypothetical protein